MNKNYKIAFLGLAQNCSKTLPNFFTFLNKIENDFNKIYLFIGENDSKDNTLDILKNYKNKKITKKIINTNFMKKYTHRLERMAQGRNYISKLLNKLKLDFVVWLDLDDVLSNGINRNEFLNSINILKKGNNLFGVSATSYPHYYDILSLRINKYFMKNIYYISQIKNIFTGYILRKKYIYNIQKKINKISKLTISSFNGMCIYKFKYYKYSSYINFNSSSKETREIVEHVIFNEKISKKFKKFILINKSLSLSMPLQHFPYSSFISFIFGKIYFSLKSF
jgi:hypothetical protein